MWKVEEGETGAEPRGPVRDWRPRAGQRREACRGQELWAWRRIDPGRLPSVGDGEAGQG